MDLQLHSLIRHVEANVPAVTALLAAIPFTPGPHRELDFSESGT
jgi:hypothetical protein